MTTMPETSSLVLSRPRGAWVITEPSIYRVANTPWKWLSTVPGLTAFTRMLCGASSLAMPLVKVETAA